MSEHRADAGEGPDVGADGKPTDENDHTADAAKARNESTEHDKREDEIIDKLGDLA